MAVVAISASYGAGGSRIAPAVAERLNVPFLDRAIPMSAADRLGISADAESDEERRRGSWLERALSGFAGGDTGVPAPLPSDSGSTERLRRETEERLLAQAGSGSGVILGRAAVIVLRDDPSTLRVRLDGPPTGRLEQAMRLAEIERESAVEAMRRLDRIHAEWTRHFYGVELTDPSLYHLMLDSTSLPFDACVELIVIARHALVADPAQA
jgi:cytidylate kinase